MRNIEEKIKFYMSLPYTIELLQEKDGSYFIKVKELNGCMSVGDTPNEAVEMIHEAMEAWLYEAIESGISIPEPSKNEKKYSGKIVLRMPKSMHKQLAAEAAEEDVSLNSYLNFLLNYKMNNYKIEKYLEKLKDDMRSKKTTVNYNVIQFDAANDPQDYDYVMDEKYENIIGFGYNEQKNN